MLKLDTSDLDNPRVVEERKPIIETAFLQFCRTIPKVPIDLAQRAWVLANGNESEARGLLLSTIHQQRVRDWNDGKSGSGARWYTDFELWSFGQK